MRVSPVLLFLLPTLAWGQSATSPLTGAETFTCNQSGVARSCTVSQIFDAMQASQLGAALHRGHLAATRTSAPTAYGSPGDFTGDLSTVQLAIEHHIRGTATLTQPTTSYVLHQENSAMLLSLINESGWNQATNDQAGGRTGVAAQYMNVGTSTTAQGDIYGTFINGFVQGTKAGSTHFLANPAILGTGGQFFSFSDGTYQEVDEFTHDDGGFGGTGYDVAVSSTVRNFTRTNNTGAKGAWWLAFRLQTGGTKPVDAALQTVGLWNNVIDTTSTISGPNKAVWTQAAGQRTYLNATAFPDGFSNPAKVAVGTTYTQYNPATSAYEVVVGGNLAMSVYSTGVNVPTFSVSNGNVALSGLPTSASGLASGRVWRNGTTLSIVP